MNLFSWPTFVPTGNWTTVGYNLTVSRQSSQGAPQPMGTYVTLATGITSNTDYYDASGNQNDLYRVTPIINITGGPSGVVFNTAQSRPFFATQPLYDVQVSCLLDAFRREYIKDVPIPLTDSTLPTESTGTNAMPFMTDALTARFFLSFLQNDDPIKFIAENVLVYLGSDKAHAAPLQQYTDFYASDQGGYLDFATAPATNNYMRVEYNKVRYTNDELRNFLLNSISSLSLYGINGYQVSQSNNLYYMASPLPNRDLGEIVMMIAHKKIVDQEMSYNLESSESWEDGKVKWSSDPGRALTAAASWGQEYEYQIINKVRNFIYQTRNYYSRGEFESFFDQSGVLPVYSIIVAGGSLSMSNFGFWL